MGSLLKMTNYDTITWDRGSSATASLIFGMPNTTQVGSEVLNQVAFPKRFIVENIRVYVRVNSKASDIPMALRINGVSVISWNIPAGVTGLQYDSGLIRQVINAEDLLANMVDLASAGAGSFSYVMFANGVWIA
jgi:hypothetical protein